MQGQALRSFSSFLRMKEVSWIRYQHKSPISSTNSSLVREQVQMSFQPACLYNMTIIKHRILFFSPFCSSHCYPSPSTFSFLLSLTFLSLFFFLSLSLSNYSAAYLHLLTNNPNSPLSPPFFLHLASVISSALFIHLSLDLSLLTEGRERDEGKEETKWRGSE